MGGDRTQIPTSELDFTAPASGEHFILKSKEAQNLNRYDFWKDASRLEDLFTKGLVTVGYAVALTNDQRYWDPQRCREEAQDEAFRIHEGRVVKGRLAWAAGADTKKERAASILLQGEYHLHWNPYSHVGQGNNMEFRYLMLEVKGPGAGAQPA